MIMSVSRPVTSGFSQPRRTKKFANSKATWKTRLPDLADRGVRREAAKRLALQQMGDPVALARQIQEVHTSVGLKEMGLAVMPHFLIAGLVAFGLCDSSLAVAVALALVGGVSWLNWRHGNPSIWSYPWLGFTLGAPAIFLLMMVIGPGKSVQAVLAGSAYPVNLSLIFLFLGYVAIAQWVTVRVVYRVVGHDWLLVAFPGIPILLLTALVLVAQWLDPAWQTPLALVGLPGALWILLFFSIAAITAAFLKFGRCHVKVGHLIISTSLAINFAYAILLVNYHLVPVRLAIAGLMAIMLAPALKKPLSSSLRVLHNVLQTTMHVMGR